MSAFENDIRRIRTLVVITSRSELERGLILLKAGLVTVEEVQNWIDANWNYTGTGTTWRLKFRQKVRWRACLL